MLASGATGRRPSLDPQVLGSSPTGVRREAPVSSAGWGLRRSLGRLGDPGRYTRAVVARVPAHRVVPPSSLAPILRSDTQGRILARLLTDPDKSYTLSELVDRVHSSMPTVQREVRRAEDAGIVVTERVGPARLVRAKRDHPLFHALRQNLLATYGPPIVAAREFGEIDGTDPVLIFGSWTARYLGEPGRAPNDIDVLVVGSPDRDEVDDAAERAERAIGLPVQATGRSRDEWSTAEDSFIREVRSRPFVVVTADPAVADDLPADTHDETHTI